MYNNVNHQNNIQIKLAGDNIIKGCNNHNPCLLQPLRKLRIKANEKRLKI